MKKSILTIGVALIATIIFTSCKKENEIKSLETPKYEKNFTCSKGSSLDLALLHNKMVAEMYNQVDFSDSTKARDMIWNNYCKNISIDPLIFEELKMSRDSFNLLSQFVYKEVSDCQFDIRKSVKYSMYGTKVFSYLNQLLSVADMFNENSTAKDMIGQVSEIKKTASSNLSGNDLVFVLSVADVLTGSIQLWLPLDMGGNGYIDLLNNEPHNKGKLTARQKEVIGAALIADASSMAIGLQVTAWTALVTGGSLAPAALVATCVEAALGSAFSAVVAWFD
mgnify:CR=1 FL=1